MCNDFGPFVVNAFGDHYLHRINGSSFNPVGYENTFIAKFGKDYFKKNHLYIITGTDSGLYLKYVLKKGIPEGSRFIFVEIPSVIERIKHFLPANKYQGRLALVPFDELVSLLDKFHFDDYVYLEGLVIDRSFAAIESHLYEYHELADKVAQEIRTRFWERSMVLSHRVFLVRKLENLAENRISAGLLQGAFSGKTAVLLAGGPSLDSALPWVKQNRDRLVIIAVSRICRRLKEFGLTPHLIVTADPHPISFDASCAMFEFSAESVLIHTDYASPPLVGQWRGKSVYLGRRIFGIPSLDGELVDFHGPTVSNVALSFAVDMGISRLLLAGVDLCYSKEGYSHASGSKDYEEGPGVMNYLRIETNDGNLAETIEDFLVAREIMGAQCELARLKGCQVVNLTAYAAKISFVDHLLPQQIQLEPLPESCESVLTAILPEEDAASRIMHYQSKLQVLRQFSDQIKSVHKLSAEAVTVNRNLFGKKSGGTLKYRKRLEKIEETLTGKYSEASQLLLRFGISHFLKVSADSATNVVGGESLERFGHGYYSAYLESATSILSLIDLARSRLEARREEEKAIPDFGRLFKQWEKDRQPGRALLWMERNADALNSLDKQALAGLKELQADFKLYLDGRKSLSVNYHGVKRELTHARTKAQTLFRKKDRAGLVKLISTLSVFSREEAKLYSWLAKGYLAELSVDPEGALEAYRNIVEQGESLVLEDALIRIASLSLALQHVDDARMAYQCLIGISPVYLPQYAELLRAIGEVEQALDIYAEYIDRFPEDIPTIVRLADFYRQLGSPEGVREVCQYLLEVDPDNMAAQHLLQQLPGNPSGQNID